MPHLDANFTVAALDPESAAHGRIDEWLVLGEALVLSAVAWGEFKCGPAGGLAPEDEASARRFLNAILPITERDAELAADLFNATGRRSRSFSDCLIAACAIAAEAPLATINTDDFKRFVAHGLRLV